MGQELLQASAMFNPSTGQWEEGEANRPIAGKYHAIGMDLQGVGATQIADQAYKLEITNRKIKQFQQNPSDFGQIACITKEDLAGDLLYLGILSYFSDIDGADQLNEIAGGQVVNFRMPSYGALVANRCNRKLARIA